MFTRSLACLAASALLTVSPTHAAVIVDADTRNGDFEVNEANEAISNGGWANAAADPMHWTSNLTTTTNPFNVSATPMIYYTAEAYNNTGVTVSEGWIYTVTADAEAVVGGGAFVDVVATENSDGTGASAVLASAVLAAGTQTGPNYSASPQLIAMTPGVSTAASAGVDGYYVQVRTRSSFIAASNYYWIDNVVVTSEVPEPASMALLLGGSMLMLARKRR